MPNIDTFYEYSIQHFLTFNKNCEEDSNIFIQITNQVINYNRTTFYINLIHKENYKVK